MNKKIVVAFLLLATPLIVTAESELEFLHKDIDALEQELDLYSEELEEQKSQADYQKHNDLFPFEVIQEPEAPIDNTAVDFVYVEVNGESIPLLDVPQQSWFARYVQDISERKIISGYSDHTGRALGLYGPADTVTVEQLAKIAVLSARVDQSKCPDVPKNTAARTSWSAGYISCAEHLGWSVYSDATVDPFRPALRADVVATILQAFNREMIPATGKVFKDVSNTMPSRYAIETAAHDGIVSGYTDENGKLTGYFGPFDSVNRAETAKIVSLALQTYSL